MVGLVEPQYTKLQFQSLIDEVKFDMTKINIITGFDPSCPIPSNVRKAGFNHRVAVVQHTYCSDSVDMYFDQRLWERILEFALNFGKNYKVCIVQREGKSEIQPDVALSVLREAKEIEREPPEFVLVRDQQELVLCIATEYWVHVGGPAPYHDSYTYSFFSKNNIAEKIRMFLAEVQASNDWEIH